MRDTVRQAFVALGGNVGDRDAALRGAVDRLRTTRGVRGLDASAVYETEPVGVTDQPRFLNQVVGIETTLTPEALLAVLQQIETEHGRVRTLRWGPRTLDLDLLVYEDEERNTPELTLPHPRMFERAFVIVPLREVLAAPRFNIEAWNGLRTRAAHVLPDEHAVWRRPQA